MIDAIANPQGKENNSCELTFNRLIIIIPTTNANNSNDNNDKSNSTILYALKEGDGESGNTGINFIFFMEWDNG